ncbi:uncharacterized protein [Palaemon carinicauda]|uniref:uncharacterized protein n=1 Tax=Palaemon carinicauda TaxID=392227 RepID=UPI0035B6592D
MGEVEERGEGEEKGEVKERDEVEERGEGAIIVYDDDNVVSSRLVMASIGWFAYATFSGFLFNPGILINPNGDSGSSGSSSSSSSSSGSSSSSSSGISVIGASVSGDSPIESIAPPSVSGDPPTPTVTGDEASILDGPMGDGVISGPDQSSTQNNTSLPSEDGGTSETGAADGGTEGGTSDVGEIPQVNPPEFIPPEVVNPPEVPENQTIPTDGAGSEDNLIPSIPVISPVVPSGVAVIRPSSTTDKEYGHVTGASTQGETTEGSHGTVLIDGEIWQIVSNITHAGFSPSNPDSDGGNTDTAILPLPVPRPTPSEGAVSISWLGLTEGSDVIGGDDGAVNTEQPEPTVAPSYPVLHACLVLGGDVPSCVAQAELYGQLLYEHTINALQKPLPDVSTEQSHFTPEMIDEITEDSLFGIEKNQFVLNNFPHASFLQPAGQKPLIGDAVESGELPSTDDQHKPFIQQILSQIQVAQASTPYVDLMQNTIKNKTQAGNKTNEETSSFEHMQVDGQNERPTPSAVLSQESLELGVSHTPETEKDPNKEDHIVSPVDDEPSTTPDSFQTHSPILTIQEKPPNINIIAEFHPQAQLITELPPENIDQLLIASEHPHGELVENDPPNAEVIQSLYPPDHLLDVIRLHHTQPHSKHKKSRAARMHHSWRQG